MEGLRCYAFMGLPYSGRETWALYTKADEIWCFFSWGSPLATMSFRFLLYGHEFKLGLACELSSVSHTALLLLFSSCLSFQSGDMGFVFLK